VRLASTQAANAPTVSLAEHRDAERVHG
jgi:hypothetical protein